MSVAEIAPLSAPRVELKSLDTLWFQVGGTVCNLACTHCFVSCSPTNHTHEVLTLAEVRRYLEEAARLGVREYYFTGGEPFLNPEMETILAATLEVGPATVLTNGLLLDPGRCARLEALADASDYSLDFRVSLDGWDAASNDPIRGEGTFERILAGIRNLHAAGLNPVITVTDVNEGAAGDDGCARRTSPRRAGIISSAVDAAWSPARASGSAPSWSTSPRRRWERPWRTPWAPSPWSTRPAGPATSTA